MKSRRKRLWPKKKLLAPPKAAAEPTVLVLAQKKRPSLDWEIKVGHPDLLVGGVDEVGRGCLAGPVVAAAIVLPAHVDYRSTPWLKEVNDSKLLLPAARSKLAPLIQEWALAFSIASATVQEIDQLNIYHASHLAMMRAIRGMKSRPAHVLVDGNRAPRDPDYAMTAIIKGDSKCLSIACASILAKVWRDEHMAQMDFEYPGYEFAVHKGYPTPAHKAALKKIGVTAIHRRSFGPVQERL